MSAPTPASGDDRPREGYYPDPSIPGYVRYWNGASWVPGTSRPAPSDGAPLVPPAAAPQPSAPAPVEETGPHFFDEDPQPRPVTPAEAQHGSRPEPASAWGADPSRQSGFGADKDRRVSWGTPQAADPRVRASGGRPAGTDGTATPPAAADPAERAVDDSFVLRRPTAGPAATPGPEASGEASGPGGDDGTMTFRPVPPGTAQQDGGPGAGPQGPVGAPASGAAGPRPGFGAGKAAAARAAAAQTPGQVSGQAPGRTSAEAPAAAGVPPQAAPLGTPAPAAAAAGGLSMTPMGGGAGGGQPSWAQQVHQLAGAQDGGPVAPWKPPVEDVFQAAARRRAAARPAGLGKRFAARFVDTLVLAAVTSAAAVPLGTRAIDHVDEKIDAAKLSGRTVTVWLLDGTTSVYLGIVLAVLLGFGVLYEVLPTARWGRTLGKKLLGLQVRDIEGHEPPAFGAALRRWLVYSVPGLLGFGVVGVLWCLFDRPWHQCWHDKAAHTFVAD
ncbi:RDD family protein [Streptomyces sp. NPDC001443]